MLLTVGETVMLPDLAAHHLLHVLRLGHGDALTLFNNQGGEYAAQILQTSRRTVTVQIQAHHSIERESNVSVHLGQVISKGDRMDWLLQKVTELGVSVVTPLMSQRCNVKLDPQRLLKRQMHWLGVIASACEQCGRNRLPQLNPVISLAEWVPHTEQATCFVLQPSMCKTDLAQWEQPRCVRLLVGPEGGLTDHEIALAKQHQYHDLSLGPRVLRTETAGITAVAWCQYQWDR